jgi:hypothetical protein
MDRLGEPATWEAGPSFVRRRWTMPPSPVTESRLGLSQSQEVTRTELVDAETIRDTIFRSTMAQTRTPTTLRTLGAPMARGSQEEEEEEEFI